jgi:hypothetical protein
MSTRLERRHIAKTASYTIKPPLDAPGTVFTNAGAAGAVTFTLPTPNKGLLGHWYRFLGVADQDIVVAAPVVDTLLTKNDAAADSLAASTSGEKIGACIEAECIQTSAGVYRWAAYGIAVGHTYTVAT